MTRNETKDFMERIKLHYQDFIVDDKKAEEWHKELKDYDYAEVNEKFEQHLRNEQYGHTIPKVAFLTKYLTKLSEKNKNEANNIMVKCNVCGASITLADFEKHTDRCNSVEYLNTQSIRLYQKELDKDYYRQMDDEKFDRIYDNVLKKILEVTNNSIEKYVITKYFESKENEVLE